MMPNASASIGTSDMSVKKVSAAERTTVL